MGICRECYEYRIIFNFDVSKELKNINYVILVKKNPVKTPNQRKESKKLIKNYNSAIDLY